MTCQLRLPGPRWGEAQTCDDREVPERGRALEHCVPLRSGKGHPLRATPVRKTSKGEVVDMKTEAGPGAQRIVGLCCQVPAEVTFRSGGGGGGGAGGAAPSLGRGAISLPSSHYTSEQNKNLSGFLGSLCYLILHEHCQSGDGGREWGETLPSVAQVLTRSRMYSSRRCAPEWKYLQNYIMSPSGLPNQSYKLTKLSLSSDLPMRNDF